MDKDFRILSISNVIKLIAVPVFIVLIVNAIGLNLINNQVQQYSYQAKSFLEGKLDVDIEKIGRLDTTHSDYTDKYYWPLGILPSVILMPFVFVFDKFGIFFKQGYLLPVITLLVIYICFKIARVHKFSKLDSLFLALGFCFGSIYALSAFVPNPWYFAGAIEVLLVLWALYEFLTRRRYWLIGVFMALVLQTRYVGALCSLFFMIEIIAKKDKPAKKLQNLISFAIPLGISLLVMLYLNQVRFGNLFDTGYPNAFVQMDFLLAARAQYGYFNPAYIPKNIYWYFLAFLDPVIDPKTQNLIPPFFTANGMGLGFFYASPIFLQLIIGFKWIKKHYSYWLVSIFILLILLTHYTTGYFTFGARYMLDFLPLWFILLLNSFKDRRLSNGHYLLIIASAFINMLLISNMTLFWFG